VSSLLKIKMLIPFVALPFPDLWNANATPVTINIPLPGKGKGKQVQLSLCPIN
jgi:hypothetical protein